MAKAKAAPKTKTKPKTKSRVKAKAKAKTVKTRNRAVAASAEDKKPDPIDVHVGSRLRFRRMSIKLSQEALGKQLGLTFQQVQKYEKGANRIGASRLMRLSRILDVPISYFFEELPGGILEEKRYDPKIRGFREEKDDSYVMEFLRSPEGLQLNRAFAKIKDASTRRKIVELVKTLAGDGDG